MLNKPNNASDTPRTALAAGATQVPAMPALASLQSASRDYLFECVAEDVAPAPPVRTIAVTLPPPQSPPTLPQAVLPSPSPTSIPKSDPSQAAKSLMALGLSKEWAELLSTPAPTLWGKVSPTERKAMQTETMDAMWRDLASEFRSSRRF